jgi:hypothetical protein
LFSKHDILIYRKKNTHRAQSSQLDVPGMIDRGTSTETSRLSLTSLQPLKVQYPEQHYTVPLRGTVQMLLHYPPPGKKRVSMTRVVFLYLQLSINVLVVYAVREAHGTKQGFFGKTRS